MEKRFTFVVNKVYEVPKFNEFFEFVKTHLKSDVKVKSYSVVYKNVTVVFETTDKNKE